MASEPVAAIHRPNTTEDAIPILQTKVQEKGQDSFKVKVQRQASLAAPLTHVATLGGATVEHLANPETWLIMLCGGGPLFVLTATHASENLPTVTFRPPNLAGSPREVDPKIVQHAEWRGPPELIYPATADKPLPSVSDQIRGINDLLRPPGTAADPTARGGPPVAGGTEPSTAILDLKLQHGLEAMARAIEAQGKNTERMFQGLVEVVKMQRQAAEPKSLVEQLGAITPLVAAVAGIISPVLVKNKDAEIARESRIAEIEAKREAREAESRAEIMKMFQSQNERASSASADTMKVIAPMVEAVSTMGRTVLQQVATMRELTAGDQPQESEFASMVKAGIAALGDYMAAKATAGAQPAQRQLPPAQTQGQTPPPPPPQDGPAPEDIEYMKTAPADEVLAHIENALRSGKDPDGNSIAPEDLADSFLNVMQYNPAAQKIVVDGGGIVPYFRTRLGEEWLSQNMQYVQRVLAALSTAARQRGMKV